MASTLTGIVNDIKALELSSRSDSSEGKLWSLSSQNVLPGLGVDQPDWLLPTHNAWGKADNGNYAAPEQQKILNKITEIIASATTVVDVSSISKVADGRFRDAIIEGARQAYAKGNRPLIRLLWGKTVFASALQGDYSAISRLVRDIAAKAPGLPVVAALTNFRDINEERSWNHSKIVAADGRVAMVGGMNLWSGDYLDTSSPVTDLSIEVQGAAARGAQLFLNELWTYVQTYGRSTVRPVDLTLTLTPTYVQSANLAGQSYVKSIPEPVMASSGVGSSGGLETVSILSVGRAGYLRNGRVTQSTAKTLSSRDADFSTGWLWNLVSDGGVMNQGDPQWDANNPGDIALRSLVRHADRAIVMTQQMLEFKFLPIGRSVFDFRLYQALADRIAAGVKVDIITSNLKVNGDYKANKPQESWDALTTLVYRNLQEKPGSINLDHSALVDLSRSMMDKGLSIKGLGISSLPGWPGQTVSPSLHSKVICVDDETFYVGSQNAYPNKLLEFGYIVENSKAASDLNRIYLDPINKYSRPLEVDKRSDFTTLLVKNDVYVGDSQANSFNGADGNDAIDGGAGNDLLRGGNGNDILTGGPGADVFLYRGLNESLPRQRGRGPRLCDVIVDFDPRSDKIDMSAIDANGLIANAQAPIWKGMTAFSGQPGELICVQLGQDLSLRLDASGDKNSDFEILLKNLAYSNEIGSAVIGAMSGV